MAERRALRRWAFFLGVTVLLSLPLALAYVWLGQGLMRAGLERHQEQINNYLHQVQEQLYDVKWDSLADTFDDSLHLGSYPENRLLVDTLRWYVYPDGHCFLEGTAVLNPNGSLRPSRLAAVVDDAGEPLDQATLAGLKELNPWLKNPWLADYSFVTKAFTEDPELEFYISPLLEAPGRLVFIMASPRRDAAGNLMAVVLQQMSVAQLFRDIIEPGSQGLNLWLMDSEGTLGFATSELAQKSAEAFVASGELAKAVAAGAAASELGGYGASGNLGQVLDGDKTLCDFRTMEDSLILGLVETEEALGSVGWSALGGFWALAIFTLLVLAAAGAVYTLAALRREARTVEKATLRRYTGTISHRLRNDLATLRGTMEFLAESKAKDPERAAEMARTGLKGVDKMEEAVRALEGLNRGETDPGHDGQLGRDTLYNLKDRAKDEEKS